MVASEDLEKFRFHRGNPGRGESSDGISSSMDSSAKGGRFSEGALAEVEERFEEGSKAVLLLRRYGEDLE